MNNLKRIKFWIKCNHLKITTSVGCIALGIIIGILFYKNVQEKNDWLISILIGLITSIAVSTFFECSNMIRQNKKDNAIKRATLFYFWNSIINQCSYMLAWKYPLYHYACDIDDMEQFIEKKVAYTQNESQKIIQFYSAVLTKQEFDVIETLFKESKSLCQLKNDKLWDTMKSKKQLYNSFYNFLGQRDKALQQMSKVDYNEIKMNVEYMYKVLQSYLNKLENAIDVFSYLFHDNTSYKNLHSDIIKANKQNQGLLEK